MKIKLGEKFGETMPGPAKANEIHYPTIRITKKPGGYAVGDDFKGSISGTIKEVRVKDDGTHECTLELHEINMTGGSVGGKKEYPSGADAMDSFMKKQKGSKKVEPEGEDE